MSVRKMMIEAVGGMSRRSDGVTVGFLLFYMSRRRSRNVTSV